MTEALAPIESVVDPKTLLARINQRLVLLRGWLSHDHGDEPYWWARRTTAPRTQRERLALRYLANLLHVERATRRGKIHGTRFATLDAQRVWLADVDVDATLVKLREGKLPS